MITLTDNSVGQINAALIEADNEFTHKEQQIIEKQQNVKVDVIGYDTSKFDITLEALNNSMDTYSDNVSNLTSKVDVLSTNVSSLSNYPSKTQVTNSGDYISTSKVDTLFRNRMDSIIAGSWMPRLRVFIGDLSTTYPESSGDQNYEGAIYVGTANTVDVKLTVYQNTSDKLTYTAISSGDDNDYEFETEDTSGSRVDITSADVGDHPVLWVVGR